MNRIHAFALLAILAFAKFAHAGTPVLGWNVDCNNYCAFNEFAHNCQGVFYYYADGTKSYSRWSTTYNACQEFAPLQANTHIIAPSLISCGCPTPAVYPPANPSAPITNATKTQLEILRAQIQEWALCAPDPTANYTDPFNPISHRNLNTCRSFRKNNLKHSYMVAGGCYKGLLGFENDGWHTCNYPGDHLANTAESCLFGDQDRCLDIKNSQDPATGMWYRNPYDPKHPETAYGQSLFSRDALMGMLSYIVVSGDKESLRKWLVFVRNNGKSPPLNLFNICPPRPAIPKPAQISQKDWDAMLPDDRCGLIPEAAGIVYKVAKYVGLTDADLNAIGTDFYSALVSGEPTVFNSILGESMTAPALGGASYQLSDTADATFLMMKVVGNHSTLINAGGHINDRTSMLSPGYHFLGNNKTPTEYGAYLITKYCKPVRPQWGMWFKSGFSGQGNNSTGYWNVGAPFTAGNYQYFGGEGPYSENILPSGHDCINWINMYVGNSNVQEPKCDAGDPLVNGACQKFTFTPPKLAAIPGIGYRTRADDNKITYTAIDMMKCPYGGTLELGEWPDYARCAIDTGAPSKTLKPGVNYTVDPSESKPGVYYSSTGGTCPNGGTLEGTKCWVITYPAPTLLQGVRYWVDTNPSWPGIYYQKVNGACPSGGVSSGPNCQVHALPSGFLSTTRTYFSRANPSYPGIYYYPNQLVPEHKIIKRVNSTGERR